MPDPAHEFVVNMKDVFRLLELHKQTGGTGPGRRHGLEVLNKSAIVLVAACWEAFVEDAVTYAFDFMVSNTRSHKSLPKKVRQLVARDLREDKNDIRVWELAGKGWRAVLQRHKEMIIKKHIGTFNTPSPHNVDNAFNDLLGLPRVSDSWRWQGMSAAAARDKLKKYIALRGEIAHRVKASKGISKTAVEDCLFFVIRLVICTANHTRRCVRGVCGKYPWKRKGEASIAEAQAS